MCEAITAMAIISAIAGGVSAAGQKQQTDTQSDILQYEADTEKLAAEDAAKRGGIAEEQQLARTRQIRAQQEAIMSASNVDLTTGTPAAVLDQTTAMGTLDAVTIRSNAAREAWGYTQKAEGSLMQKGMTQQAGAYGAAGTLLGGAARAYGTYKGVK
jgi:hypothetical protein